MRKFLCWPLRLGLLCIVTTGLPADAQTPPTDLADLSIEELLRVELIEGAAAEEGEPGLRWTLGYRFVRKEFEGYREGTESRSFDEILARYPVVPTRILQEAHLVDASFRLNSRLSMAVLVPFIHQSTDHIRRGGPPFILTSDGFGDVLVSVARVMGPQREDRALGLSLGVRFPTGSIHETGDTPRGPDTPLPYTMQLGSGTYDLEPGATWTAQYGRQRVGVHAGARMRLGRNDRGYHLGDWFTLSGWVALEVRSGLELSLYLDAETWGRIDGEDPALNPALAPVADAQLYGGERIHLEFRVDWRLPRWRRHELTLGVMAPFFQSLNGPQPELDLRITGGWKWRSR